MIKGYLKDLNHVVLRQLKKTKYSKKETKQFNVHMWCLARLILETINMIIDTSTVNLVILDKLRS